MRDRIEKTLNRIACTVLNERTPIANDANVTELGADSLDMIEMIMGIEEEFRMEIPDADAERLLTINQMTDYLIEHKDEIYTNTDWVSKDI